MSVQPSLPEPGVLVPGASADTISSASQRKLPVARMAARRLGAGVLTLWLISLVVFGATQALPGSTAEAVLGRQADDARVEQLERELGLDRPMVRQYGSWLVDALQGDFGTSLSARPPMSVNDLVAPRLERTLVLMAGSAALGIPAGIALGVWAAARRDRTSDRVSSVLLLVLAALPEFVIGVVLVVLLSTEVVHLFPAVALIDPSRPVVAQLDRVALPILTLALAIVPYIARYTRATMIEVLESDFVEMAHLKGVPTAGVVWRHALPNVVPAMAQVVALVLAYLAGGAVIVEGLFQYPGLGLALLDAVRLRDLPMVQALTMFIATTYIVLNIVADLVAVVFTPRLRTAL